jgi:tetratricopeptide (TPR) repeat protein
VKFAIAMFAAIWSAGLIARAEPVAPAASGLRADADAADKLASLKRAVEPMTDIDQIILRFERFAGNYPGTEASAEASAEAALWRERKQQGMVKLGSDWVTPDERARRLSQVAQQITAARDLIASGAVRDAEGIVNGVLALDPKNISGLYLNGLILLQYEKLPQARKAFEAVNAQIADHAPTLNNLAVISFRQNQSGAALNFYEQAMSAAPADRAIIDNVAEALFAMKDDQRRTPIAKRVARLHAEQEAVLAAHLARQNLYRWGATWVTKATLEQLQAEERRITQRVTELETTLAERKRDVAITEDRIVATERSLRSMEADRYTYSVDGRVIVLPLPTAYYEMQRDLQVFQRDRLRQIAAVEQVQAEIRSTRQDLPVPRYTGVQRPIGAEGTPIEAAPATQPS